MLLFYHLIFIFATGIFLRAVLIWGGDDDIINEKVIPYLKGILKWT